MALRLESVRPLYGKSVGRDFGEERGVEALHLSLSDARFLVLRV